MGTKMQVPFPLRPPPTLYARQPLLKSGLILSTPLQWTLSVHSTASSASVELLQKCQQIITETHTCSKHNCSFTTLVIIIIFEIFRMAQACAAAFPNIDIDIQNRPVTIDHELRSERRGVRIHFWGPLSPKCGPFRHFFETRGQQPRKIIFWFFSTFPDLW